MTEMGPYNWCWHTALQSQSPHFPDMKWLSPPNVGTAANSTNILGEDWRPAANTKLTEMPLAPYNGHKLLYNFFLLLFTEAKRSNRHGNSLHGNFPGSTESGGDPSKRPSKKLLETSGEQSAPSRCSKQRWRYISHNKQPNTSSAPLYQQTRLLMLMNKII